MRLGLLAIASAVAVLSDAASARNVDKTLDVIDFRRGRTSSHWEEGHRYRL
jgi:hypothetical protein